MKVRRVVTGHTPDGKATFASDSMVDAITLDLLPGTEFLRLWGADKPPTFPDDGSPRPAPSYFPLPGGCRFGMHTTDTVDFEYVISGEVWLALDDGREVHLKARDIVVQNGTRHAWRNRGDEPCRLAVCLIGAHRR